MVMKALLSFTFPKMSHVYLDSKNVLQNSHFQKKKKKGEITKCMCVLLVANQYIKL